ncbi:hypothetical protein FKM82_009861 [Ascaphus truei]
MKEKNPIHFLALMPPVSQNGPSFTEIHSPHCLLVQFILSTDLLMQLFEHGLDIRAAILPTTLKTLSLPPVIITFLFLAPGTNFLRIAFFSRDTLVFLTLYS